VHEGFLTLMNIPFSIELPWLVVACLLILCALSIMLAWRLQKKNRLLRLLVQHDGLTGALNHTETNVRCEIEAERAMRTQKSFAVLEIDIDHFKHVNDRYGHQIGDEILVGLVQCIKINLRTMDLFGRIGGEEFIVILPETDQSGAVQTAERLRQDLALHVYTTSCGELKGITVSIGVAVFVPSEHAHADKIAVRQALFKQADEAMYTAKNAGRNRVVLFSA
jgi:diguanylate cyclase (GGDEF)-like protein